MRPARLVLAPGDSLAVAVHHILHPQEQIARRLKHAANLEGPRNRRGRGEEPEHLHAVAHQPAGQDREPEPLARPRPGIREDLRDGQRRLDRQPDVPDERRIRLVHPGQRGQQELADDQAGEQGQQKLPVPRYS